MLRKAGKSGPSSGASTASGKKVAKQVKQVQEELRHLQEQRSEESLESKQHLESLSAQVSTLRNAFGTLSDVLVEEIDSVRNDVGESNETLKEQVRRLAKACNTFKGEMANLQSFQALTTKQIAELQQACTGLAKDLASMRAQSDRSFATATAGLSSSADREPLSQWQATQQRQLQEMQEKLEQVLSSAQSEGKRGEFLSPGSPVLPAGSGVESFLSERSHPTEDLERRMEAMTVELERIRKDHQEVSLALARDVSTLAEECSEIKNWTHDNNQHLHKQIMEGINWSSQNAQQEVQVLRSSVERQQQDMVEVGAQIRQELARLAAEVDRRVQVTREDLSGQSQILHETVASVQHQHRRLQESFSDSMEQFMADVRTLQQHLRILEENHDLLRKEVLVQRPFSSSGIPPSTQSVPSGGVQGGTVPSHHLYPATANPSEGSSGSTSNTYLGMGGGPASGRRY